MSRLMRVLRTRGIDFITVLMFLLAGYLLLQPGSQLRTAWARNRADADAVAKASRIWTDLADISAPLFQGHAEPTVVEVSDYECPFCRKNSPAVDSAVAAGVLIAYLHLPLPSHPRAEGAAKAALCAESVGKFREMHARLMETAQWRTDSNWVREARLAGISDLARFERCLAGEEAVRRLVRHKALAETLQVTGTPTFISRRGIHRGLASTKHLVDLD